MLDVSLKQSVGTRWDSILELLESINTSFEQLLSLAKSVAVLNEKSTLINKQLIEKVITLLLPFRTARKKLCRNSVPTFHEFALIKQHLLKSHLEWKTI